MVQFVKPLRDWKAAATSDIRQRMELARAANVPPGAVSTPTYSSTYSISLSPLGICVPHS